MNKSNRFLDFSRAAVLALVLVPSLFSVLSETGTKSSESIELSSDSSCLYGLDKNIARQRIAKFAESTLYIPVRNQAYPYGDLALPWQCSLVSRVSVSDGIASLYPDSKKKWVRACIHEQLFKGSARETSFAWQKHGWSRSSRWVKTNGGLKAGDLLFQPYISSYGHVGIVVLKNGTLMVAENNGVRDARWVNGAKDYRMLTPLRTYGAFESVGRFGGF